VVIEPAQWKNLVLIRVVRNGLTVDHTQPTSSGTASNLLSCSNAAAARYSKPNQEIVMNDLRVNDLFSMEPIDDVFRGLLRPWRMEMGDGAPKIKVDVTESDGNYVLKADVPGVKKEDIDVRIDGNQVTISAESKKETEEKKDGRVLRSERHYGYASRSLWLDCPIDDANSAAKYQDGVLELTLPKKTETSAKRLSIG
jgi:HSP20 family protein